MKKHYLAVAVAAAFAVQGVAYAQDYQMEAGVTYADFDGDDSAVGVDFTYHLETVSTANRPLTEAYFLGRNSNLFAAYFTADKVDLDTISIGGEFWIEDIYLAAGLSQTDDGVDTFDDYLLSAGYMLQDGALVYIGFEDGDSSIDPTYHIGTKYVGKLGENFVNLEADLASNDGDNTLTLLGDYFFSNEFSAGVRVAESDVSGVDTEFGVGAKYFFTPVVSGEVEYSTQDSFDIMMVRVAARF
ncbi:MAG: putative porin [Alcanivoracaceae bacterium]|jgi:hypothetical protein|nr:putative porin [Alcanivoracaceae bacterium]